MTLEHWMFFADSGPTATPTPQSTQCQDKLNNCQAFGKSACTGQFEPWARDNCRLYCGFCSKLETSSKDTNSH